MTDELDPIWKALSDPTRRRLLDLLTEAPHTTGELAASFALTRFAIMKHLAVLESAGLITVRRRGRERWNYLNRVPLSRIYSRWVSQQTAWMPTLEGQAQSHAPLATPDEGAELEVIETEPLKQIYLSIRPEEKYTVERTLQSVVPPLYVSMHATGRGGVEAETDRSIFPWRRNRRMPAFLPKTMFYLVVPETYVDPILVALRSALRIEGSPNECGDGYAVVIGLEEEIVIGAGRSHDPKLRAAAEGWFEGDEA